MSSFLSGGALLALLIVSACTTSGMRTAYQAELPIDGKLIFSN